MPQRKWRFIIHFLNDYMQEVTPVICFNQPAYFSPPLKLNKAASVQVIMQL